MVGTHRLLRGDLAVGDPAQEANEGELVFGVVDLAAKQGHTRAVLFRLAEQFEGVIGRARGTAEDADDEMRVVADQLFHGTGAVVNHLEKQRPALGRDAAQSAYDRVVDELWQFACLDGLGAVRIENLEEMAEVLALRLLETA